MLATHRFYDGQFLVCGLGSEGHKRCVDHQSQRAKKEKLTRANGRFAYVWHSWAHVYPFLQTCSDLGYHNDHVNRHWSVKKKKAWTNHILRFWWTHPSDLHIQYAYHINQWVFFCNEVLSINPHLPGTKGKSDPGKMQFPRIAWVILSQPGLRGYLLLWWIILLRDGLKWVSSPVGSAIHELLAVVGNPCRTMRREGNSLNVFICNLNPTSSCCYTCPALLFSHCWLCVCFWEGAEYTEEYFVCTLLSEWRVGVLWGLPGGICSLGVTIANKCSSCNSFLTNLTFQVAFDRENSWRTFVERALCISSNAKKGNSCSCKYFDSKSFCPHS